MDIDELEILVQKCKKGCTNSKEELLNAFKPLVLSLAKRTFIHGYTFQDIQDECYHSLLYCLNLYKTDSHSFVSYTSRTIKNNLNYLIKKGVKHEDSEGACALTLSDNMEHILPDNHIPFEDYVHLKNCYKELNEVIKSLNSDEKEMINFLYVQNRTLKCYSHLKNISYSSARYKQRKLLKKLHHKMNEKHIYSMYNWQAIVNFKGRYIIYGY